MRLGRSDRLSLTFLAAVASLGWGAGCAIRPPSPPPDSRFFGDPAAYEVSVQSKMMQYQMVGPVIVGVGHIGSDVSHERTQ